MKKRLNPHPKLSADEAAIEAFRQSERQLQELLGGKIDSIMLQDGQQHLLRGAQEMLRQSEARFRNMFTASVTGMAISSPQGRFLEVNAAYCRILGYTKDELVTLSFSDLTHPEDLALNLKLRDEILDGSRDSFVMEKRYLKKGGGSIWVNHSVSATRTATGNVGVFVVVAEDITERREAELRLIRLNRLHAVLSEVSEAIMRQRERQDLYDKICQIVVDRGRLRLAFIVEVVRGTSAASPVSSFGQGLGEIIPPPGVIPIDEEPLKEGIVETAIRTGVYNVCNDMRAGEPMRSHEVNGPQPCCRASAAFPFRINDAATGIVVLGAEEVNYFQADEIALMITVSENLAFAIENIEKDRQRQKAEERSNHLAAIVESSADAIISEDLDGIITSWNRGAVDLFGYAANEIVGTSILRLIPADRQDEENGIISSAKHAKSLQNFETLRQAKDGRLINVSLTVSPIKNSAGDIIGLSKVARDMTESKRSEARFRRLVDSNAQGVFFWRIKGEIYDANDAFLALIGYTRQDLQAGRVDWIALTPPEYTEIDQTSIKECAHNGFCRPYGKEFIRRDGVRIPIFIGSATFDDNQDEGVSFVVDLTEQKKLEQQFRQAQKMEAIGNLAGGVAHDFNNILSVIHIQADLLKTAGNLSEDQIESTEDIIAAVERAAALTRQLLLFSSREVFQPQDIDLSESITSTVKMLKRLVGEQIEMQFKMASQPMFIHADSTMMDQVLLNLVVNARDAMPNGGHLVIETAGVEFDEFAASQSASVQVGSFVCLSVTDSGCGIPPEHFSRIFEPFFTTKDVGKGTGLGLATVFGIVQQHKGWINVYSEIDHGTTFRVYLPRLAKDAGHKPSRPDLNATFGGSETVLLVEDDQRLRGSVRTALSQLGYRVLEAQNGLTALDVWRTRKDEIDLLLTDLVMPGAMTGKQLAQALIADNAHLKVIYMSGYSVEAVGKDFPLKEGFNFLSKPFPATKLAKLVRSSLDSGQNSALSE